MDELEARILDRLRTLDGLIVGFSGGVDSGLLSDLAHEALAARSLVVTAVSPSLPTAERQHAATVASRKGWRHQEVETHELDRPAYVANTTNRCFHCRTEFFEVLETVRATHDIEHVAIGTIVDDLGDHRPGNAAALRHGVLRPLADAGATKDDVRRLARRRGLELWDKPATACLSSRIPYGQPVTRETLSRIEAAEEALRRRGFAVCRVRDHGGSARIEVPDDRLQELIDDRQAVVAELRQAGYQWIALDLEGFRSGSLNRVQRTVGGVSA